jgi:hypothetical protein
MLSLTLPSLRAAKFHFVNFQKKDAATHGHSAFTATFDVDK